MTPSTCGTAEWTKNLTLWRCLQVLLLILSRYENVQFITLHRSGVGFQMGTFRGHIWTKWELNGKNFKHEVTQDRVAVWGEATSTMCHGQLSLLTYRDGAGFKDSMELCQKHPQLGCKKALVQVMPITFSCTTSGKPSCLPKLIICKMGTIIPIS